MKKLLLVLLLVTVLTNANAQPEIKESGSIVKTGDIIHGVVRDLAGAVKLVDVFEVNNKNKVVAYTLSDINGHFSLKIVNPDDSLYVGGRHYYTAKCPITDNKYDITVERLPEGAYSAEMNRLFRQSYATLVSESKNYPILVIDRHEIYRGNKDWEDIDPSKDKYTKQEMSRLFGVEAGQIETIEVIVQGSELAKDMLGPDSNRGLINIHLKTKEGK